MYVGAVEGVCSGSSGINPILIERYAILNKELHLKRIKKEEKIEPIIELDDFKVNTIENNISPAKLREIYANPIMSRIPIKIAYTILQRLCDEAIKFSQITEYQKTIGFRMYGN